ncbi:MAG: hypothetical protein IJN92_09810 [Lachnospiraceae bacterium]|nr:hypothetical protein [Lachnospiraceae bacterium]
MDNLIKAQLAASNLEGVLMSLQSAGSINGIYVNSGVVTRGNKEDERSKRGKNGENRKSTTCLVADCHIADSV